MGVSDVDPFIMGLTQAAGTLDPVQCRGRCGAHRRLQQ